MRTPHSYEQRADQAAAAFFAHAIRPSLLFILALGRYVAFTLGAVGSYYATGMALGDGVSPASMTTADLPQSQVTYYDKAFLEPLRANTPWMRNTTRRELPANSGNKLELFMYQNLGANPVPAAEGTVGSGIKASVISNVSAIGQFADFMNLSDMVMQTTIDPAVESLTAVMSYRLAQTINVIVQNTADAAAAVDASVAAHSKAYNVPIATTDITNNVQSLAGRNVLPMEGGFYGGIVHPFIIGDFLNDNAANGIVDVAKRTAEGAQRLRELPETAGGDSVPVLEWGGARFMSSTLVRQTPNYQGHGTTALRTYLIGRDGVITISLGATENTSIGDGDYRNLKMWVKKITEPEGYDPSRMIGAFISYNMKMTATLPPDPTQRIRIIDAVPVVS